MKNRRPRSAAIVSRSYTTVSAVLAASLGACASAGPDDGAAVTGASALASKDSAAHVAHERALAEAAQAPTLDTSFGRFVRGEARVYRGTFAAHDNLATIEPPTDGDFPKGAAIAILTSDQGQSTLSVVAPASGEHVEFVQDGATTNVSLVNAPSSVGGLLSACTGCFPDLAPAPATIDFAGVSADGVYGDGKTPSHVHAAGTLSLVPAKALVFADLAALRVVDGLFVAHGADRVETIHDTNSESLPFVPGLLPCSLETDYAIDLWVAQDDVSKFGTRNFSILAERTCCARSSMTESGSVCTPLAASTSVHTGVGNTAKLTLDTAPTDDAPLVARTLRVDYADTTGYFKQLDFAVAVLTVHTSIANGEATRKYVVDLTRSAAHYRGDVVLPDASTVTAIDAAFADEQEHTWDSNASRNYRFTF